MNKKYYTLGPWHVIAHDQVRDANGQFIASCELPRVNFRKGEAEANAALIASAPDLVTALLAVIGSQDDLWYCEHCDSHAPKDPHGKLTGEKLTHKEGCPILIARAAIAKAKGQ